MINERYYPNDADLEVSTFHHRSKHKAHCGDCLPITSVEQIIFNHLVDSELEGLTGPRYCGNYILPGETECHKYYVFNCPQCGCISVSNYIGTKLFCRRCLDFQNSLGHPEDLQISRFIFNYESATTAKTGVIKTQQQYWRGVFWQAAIILAFIYVMKEILNWHPF